MYYRQIMLKELGNWNWFLCKPSYMSKAACHHFYYDTLIYNKSVILPDCFHSDF